MNKSILVIDTPKSCMKCPLRFKDGDTDDWFRFRCHMSTDQIPEEGRLRNCLLKPLPQKIEGYIDYEYGDGWNDCIDKIFESNK